MIGIYITSNRREISLGEKLGYGAEGDVYKVRESSHEALKLYKPENRTPERERKLEAMIIAPPRDNNRSLPSPHVSIAWPTDIVYERDTKQFIGFIMPLIPKSPKIYEVYNPKLREINQLSITWQHLHRIARNFATALNSLHMAGHIMGDINQQNVLVASNSLVTLVDTDSFQVTDSRNRQVYRCTVGVGEYTPPELQGLKFDSIDRTIYNDSFGLAVIIFQMLMEGYHPFAGAFDPKMPALASTLDGRIKSGIFHYQTNHELNPSLDAPNFQTLYPKVQQLFLRCFVDGHKNPLLRPTPQDWIHTLTKAESELVQCRNNSLHWYSGHFGRCHWCEHEQNKKPLPIQLPLAIPSLLPPSTQAKIAPSKSQNIIQKQLSPQKTSKVIVAIYLTLLFLGYRFLGLISDYSAFTHFFLTVSIFSSVLIGSSYKEIIRIHDPRRLEIRTLLLLLLLFGPAFIFLVFMRRDTVIQMFFLLMLFISLFYSFFFCQQYFHINYIAMAMPPGLGNIVLLETIEINLVGVVVFLVCVVAMIIGSRLLSFLNNKVMIAATLTTIASIGWWYGRAL